MRQWIYREMVVHRIRNKSSHRVRLFVEEINELGQIATVLDKTYHDSEAGVSFIGRVEILAHINQLGADGWELISSDSATIKPFWGGGFDASANGTTTSLFFKKLLHV